MNNLFTEENNGIINNFLNNDEFREIVENDLGKVSKVTVDWNANNIHFHGSRLCRDLPISLVLTAFYDRKHWYRRDKIKIVKSKEDRPKNTE